MPSIVVQDTEAGFRLDVVLCARLSLSRAAVKKLVERGDVRLNQRKARKGELVRGGDQLDIELAALSAAAVPDETVPFTVRFEDAELVVVDKPAGVPSHPLLPEEAGCLANGLVAHYPEMSKVGYDARQPGLVNRLDNDTSGLVLAARTSECFELLREQLRSGAIRKRYLALTTRPVASQRIELPLKPSDKGPRVELAAMNDAGRRAALTAVTGCRELGEDRYVVELEASPAYRHQVRVHLAAIGRAIVGDTQYGGIMAARHYLHASRVEFAHPRTGEHLVIESPLPPDWSEA